MYRILRGEMVKVNISVAVLAKEIGVSEKTLRNKLNGETDFTFPEARTIRGIINANMKLEDLFEKEEQVEEEV